MILDFILYCALGIMTVILAVLGGHVSSNNIRHRMYFYVLGGISVVLITATGFRSYLSQEKAEETSNRLDATIASLQRSSEAISNMSKETIRIGRLNTQLENQSLKQSKAIADLSQKTLNTAIGGDSFCYISTMNAGAEGWWAVFDKKGTYPLYDVSAKIFDREKIRQLPSNYGSDPNVFLNSHIVVHIGNVSSEKEEGVSGYILQFIPMSKAPEHTYDIYFTARNGYWYEKLKIININGQYWGAIQVSIKGKILFEQVPDVFPRNNKGQVEW